MDRRTIISAATTLGIGTGLLSARQAVAADAPSSPPAEASSPAFVRAADGTQLFCRDWGSGAPVLFLAAWGLPSEAWQYQMVPLADQGFRCVAFDRRSHGRSSDPGRGYDLDTLAGDVASVIEHCDLQDATVVGHSLGGAEAVRYLSTHGEGRVRRLVLVAPTTPMLLRAEDNPDGLPPAAVEGLRQAMRQDFPGLLVANIKPFVTPATSQAMIDWIVAMMTRTPLKALLA